MARFKKFYQRIPRNGYNDLFTIELQSNSRIQDPEIKLIYEHNGGISTAYFPGQYIRVPSIIITKLSVLNKLVAEINQYREKKFEEKEAKKIARQKSQSKN